MYLEKMAEEEMGRFCDKLTIREMNNLYIILCEYYRMGNDEDNLFKMFKENYDRCLDSTLYSCSIDTKLLDINEFKNMLLRFDFKELYVFGKVINILYKYVRSEYYKNLNFIINNLLKEYSKFILEYKDLENMSRAEMEHYVNNRSESTLENYGLAINSKNEIPTAEEMYEYYHDREIKGMRLVRNG